MSSLAMVGEWTGEDALHAHPHAHLAHGESLMHSAAFAGYDRAFKNLNPLAAALGDIHMHFYLVAMVRSRGCLLADWAWSTISVGCMTKAPFLTNTDFLSYREAGEFAALF